MILLDFHPSPPKKRGNPKRSLMKRIYKDVLFSVRRDFKCFVLKYLLRSELTGTTGGQRRNREPDRKSGKVGSEAGHSRTGERPSNAPRAREPYGAPGKQEFLRDGKNHSEGKIKKEEES